MIDSHAHLGMASTEALPDIIKKAQLDGVDTILSIACAMQDVAPLQDILQQYAPYVLGAVGIHPENLDDFNENTIEHIFNTTPNLIAYGEIGLDYFYGTDNHDLQCDVFERQLALAAKLKKPVIIHTRDAQDDTIDILTAAYNKGQLDNGGILHCFTGSQQLADKALELGLYISASGIITFKKSEQLRDVFKTIPQNRLLVETDAPFLAPVPYRGKENQSAYVAHTLQALADIKNITTDEMNIITNTNFNTLFKKELK